MRLRKRVLGRGVRLAVVVVVTVVVIVVGTLNLVTNGLSQMVADPTFISALFMLLPVNKSSSSRLPFVTIPDILLIKPAVAYKTNKKNLKKTTLYISVICCF
jgi:hypothetical protein